MKTLGKLLILCLALILTLTSVLSQHHRGDGIREKRGAAYAGSHPGGGYGSAGVGIPGLTNVIQYSAYNQLLNSGHQSPSSGYGGNPHRRKLTVDQAIGQYGHHTLSPSSPYTNHGSGGGGYGGGSSPTPSVGGGSSRGYGR